IDRGHPKSAAVRWQSARLIPEPRGCDPHEAHLGKGRARRPVQRNDSGVPPQGNRQVPGRKDVMQRLLDILLSGLALLVLSPLLVPVALLLRFTGEGEVLFRQRRVGKDGKPFNLYKFATMLKDSP